MKLFLKICCCVFMELIDVGHFLSAEAKIIESVFSNVTAHVQQVGILSQFSNEMEEKETDLLIYMFVFLGAK